MRFILGTAQFGMNYGITNSSRPNNKEVNQILRYCLDHSIHTIDTAQSYGVSEKIIGDFSSRKDFMINTKISCSNELSLSELVDISLSRLKVNSIDGVYIHDTQNLSLFENLKHQIDELKKDNIVKEFGISVYDQEEYDSAMQFYDFDMVQVPVNLFDQRLIRNGFLERMRHENKKIHARSIFLQGLLLERISLIPKKFHQSIDEFKRFEEFVEVQKISKLDACIAFIKSLPLDGCIIGINSLDQLQSSSDSFQKNISLDHFSVKLNDETIIDPRYW